MKLSKGTNALFKLTVINWFEEIAEDKVVYRAYMKSAHTHTHLLRNYQQNPSKTDCSLMAQDLRTS